MTRFNFLKPHYLWRYIKNIFTTKCKVYHWPRQQDF